MNDRRYEIGYGLIIKGNIASNIEADRIETN